MMAPPVKDWVPHRFCRYCGAAMGWRPVMRTIYHRVTGEARDRTIRLWACPLAQIAHGDTSRLDGHDDNLTDTTPLP